MAPTPIRAKSVERALEGRTLDAAGIAPAIAVAAEGTAPETDAIASAWYRREVVAVYLRRLLLGTEGDMKTPVQFRHNGQDVAVFVDGGASLLSALRDGVGDTSPKFGCGQGTCGVCSVLIDGELHLSCITLAETVQGARGRDRRRPQDRRASCIRCRTPSWTISPRSAGFCTPGMMMAAKALLDRNPAPTRAEVVEAISGNICRCTGYEPIINAVLAAAGNPAAAPEDTAMLELRKDIFARRA